MPKPGCRPFGVLDAMTLVAAAGAGFWFLELYFRHTQAGWGELTSMFERPWALRKLYLGTMEGARNFRLILLPVTAAVALLRLRGPRPSIRRLSRQPGFAACLIVSALTAAAALGHAVSMAERTTWGDGYSIRLNIGFLQHLLDYQIVPEDTFLGASVASVWGVMALGRVARPEPGWIDRTGRLLGAFWVLTFVLSVSAIQLE